MNYCTKCGLLPQLPEKPKPCCTPSYCKPKCCRPSRCKKCCNELSTTEISASLGDDKTGEYTATPGLFSNMVVTYEANGAKYIYDANGVYTLLVKGD